MASPSSDRQPRGIVIVLLRAWHRIPRGLRVVLPVAEMAALWWSSSRRPGDEPVGQTFALLHNMAHVVAYAVLAGLLWLAWSRTLQAHDSSGAEARRSAGAFLLATVYGAVDEWHQSWVPGRDSSLADLCSDAAGALFAVLLLHGIARRGRPGALAWLVLTVGVASSSYATFGS